MADPLNSASTTLTVGVLENYPFTTKCGHQIIRSRRLHLPIAGRCPLGIVLDIFRIISVSKSIFFQALDTERQVDAGELFQMVQNRTLDTTSFPVVYDLNTKDIHYPWALARVRPAFIMKKQYISGEAIEMSENRKLVWLVIMLLFCFVGFPLVMKSVRKRRRLAALVFTPFLLLWQRLWLANVGAVLRAMLIRSLILIYRIPYESYRPMCDAITSGRLTAVSSYNGYPFPLCNDPAPLVVQNAFSQLRLVNSSHAHFVPSYDLVANTLVKPKFADYVGYYTRKMTVTLSVPMQTNLSASTRLSVDSLFNQLDEHGVTRFLVRKYQIYSERRGNRFAKDMRITVDGLRFHFLTYFCAVYSFLVVALVENAAARLKKSIWVITVVSPQ